MSEPLTQDERDWLADVWDEETTVSVGAFYPVVARIKAAAHAAGRAEGAETALADPTIMVIRTAIPLTADAVRTVGEAIENAAIEHLGRDLGTVHRDDIARAAIWSTLDALRVAAGREQAGA